ncbi:hypothetical protein [Snuella lapsa]
MSSHFCKVGKIKPNINKLIGKEELLNVDIKVIDVTFKTHPFED